MAQAIAAPPVARLIGVLMAAWGAAEVLRTLAGVIATLEVMMNPAALVAPSGVAPFALALYTTLLGVALLVTGLGLLRGAAWAWTWAVVTLIVAILYRLITGLAPLVDLMRVGFDALFHVQTVLTVLLQQAPLLLALLYLNTAAVHCAWSIPAPDTDAAAACALALRTRMDALLRRLPAMPPEVSFIALLLLIWAAQYVLSVFSGVQQYLVQLRQADGQSAVPFTLIFTGSALLLLLGFTVAGIGLLRRAAWGRAAALGALGLAVLSSLLIFLLLVIVTAQEAAAASLARRPWAREGLILTNLLSVLIGAMPSLAALLFLRATPPSHRQGQP